MRKSLCFLAGLGAIVIAASCNKKAASVEESEVVFQIEISQDPSTKVDGVSEAALVDTLNVFVFDADSSYISTIVPTVTKTDQTHYNVKIRLLNNVTYHFAFFAQKKGTYAFSSDKKTIAIDYTGMSANSDASDAFFAHINGYTVSGSFTRSVTLSRPFAQINFGAVKADYQAAAASQVAFDETLNTAITVKQAPTVLNLLSGEVSAPTDVSFLPAVYMGNTAASANLTVTPEAFPGATPVRYMGMVYILADAETASTLSKVTMSISGLQNGSAFSSSRDVTNVPVRRNFRTQIVGNVFTDEGTFNITLVPVYDTPDNEENL